MKTFTTRHAGLVAAFMIALVLVPLLPGEIPAAEPMPGTEAPDLSTAVLKMAGALVMLIAGLLAVLYLVRRYSAGGKNLFGGREIIRVIGTKALAPKKYIALVEVGGRVLTLGVTADRITCLDRSSAEDFHAEFQPDGEMQKTGGFARVFKSATGAPSGPAQDDAP